MGTTTYRHDISFLFVVNELGISLDSREPGKDVWGNVHPPTDIDAYTNETASHVMRWQHGSVQKTDRYCWNRPDGWGKPGNIYAADGNGSALVERPKPTYYKEFTVFACNPHLPIVVAATDATLGETVVSLSFDPPEHTWCLLHFRHPREPNMKGVSQVVSCANGRQYVAGKNPSWMPSLIPNTFENQYTNTSSKGLGGELPLVLGLMAFSEKVDRPHRTRMHDTFLKTSGSGATLRDQRWRPSRADRGPRGYPAFEDNPRGFLVHVCLDDLENPDKSTGELLNWFEWNDVMVREN